MLYTIWSVLVQKLFPEGWSTRRSSREKARQATATVLACANGCYKNASNHAKLWYAKDYGYVGGFYGKCSHARLMREVLEHGPVAVRDDLMIMRRVAVSICTDSQLRRPPARTFVPAFLCIPPPPLHVP